MSSSVPWALIGRKMPARPNVPRSLSETSSSLSTPRSRRVYPKSDVQIHIQNHYKTKTYTSSSPLSGEVTITTQRDVPFDTIEIILFGSSRTRTEGYSAPHESQHTFLKMTMPISESTYPVPRVLESGRTLTIPFNFVLPSFLTLSACNHKVQSEDVRAHHLCLPPSMGSWARGNREKDDMAPHMAEVEYSIKARVWREADLQERPIKVMEAVKPIQVIPAVAESAPLNLPERDHDIYRMTKTKTIRKNLISTKVGRLTVSGQQPGAVMLQPDGTVLRDSTALIDVKFEPVSPDVQPPKITSVSAKVTAHTYYSASAVHIMPDTTSWVRAGLVERRGVYTNTVTLPHSANTQVNPWITYQSRRDSGYKSNSPPESLASSEDDESAEDFLKQQQQQQQFNKKTSRRQSTMSFLRVRPKQHQSTPTPHRLSMVHTTSSSTLPPPSHHHHHHPRRPSLSPVYHTTALHVPITLPTAKRAFVPTFHSCILSRVYVLHVAVTVANGTTLSVDLPLQVGVEGYAPPLADEALPSFEDAVEAAAADEFLRPRVLGGGGFLPGRGPGGEARAVLGHHREGSALPAYGTR